MDDLFLWAVAFETQKSRYRVDVLITMSLSVEKAPESKKSYLANHGSNGIPLVFNTLVKVQ